jgi:hypothetical protein
VASAGLAGVAALGLDFEFWVLGYAMFDGQRFNRALGISAARGAVNRG